MSREVWLTPPAVNWPQPMSEAGSPSAYSMRKGSGIQNRQQPSEVDRRSGRARGNGNRGDVRYTSRGSGSGSLAGRIAEQDRACEREFRDVCGGQIVGIVAETSHHGGEGLALIEPRDAGSHRIEQRVALLRRVGVDVHSGPGQQSPAAKA
jgi:hypothetical protein